MADRNAVYMAIDTERRYQDLRWNSETTTSDGLHSLEEWFVYIEDYVSEAKHVLSRKPRQVADVEALVIMRKVAAMAVCAMEQHGAPMRVLPPELYQGLDPKLDDYPELERDRLPPSMKGHASPHDARFGPVKEDK